VQPELLQEQKELIKPKIDEEADMVKVTESIEESSFE
jgi:hypothetical protein